MSGERPGDYKVQQLIDGEGHQIAGGDIINEGDGFKPDPNNPKLKKCDYCEWPGLAIDAPECRKCGHNYADDWARAAQLAEEQRKEAGRWLLLILVGVLVAGINIAQKLGLTIMEGIVIAVVAGGALWMGWIYSAAYLQVWLEQRKRRR